MTIDDAAVRLGRVAAVSLAALLAIGLDTAQAQGSAQNTTQEDMQLGWSNTTDLSLVVTEGNSDSTTLGFSNQLHHRWENARFDFDISGVHSYKSDDRFFLIEPGLEFPVGGAPSDASSSLIEPEPTLDVATYLVRLAFERDLSPRLFWNAGVSWDRNEDAGIVNRYIAHGGFGTNWVDTERRRLATTYGFSYTDREEEDQDPEKDRRFGGGRLGWDYTERFNEGTTFDSDFAMNGNLSDPNDYSISTLNALTVSINDHLSIKVSVQWLFENEPALETDLDVIAYVEVVNPDGIPGSGDERFRTLPSGGTKLVLGSSDARKERLDTIIRTALVIKF